MITAAIEFVNWYLFASVKGFYLTLLRITVFGLPLYLLLSRFYTHLGNIPTHYFESQYRGKRLSTLTYARPEQVPFNLIYLLSLVSCVTGLVGVTPAISAVIASFAIIILNNYYSSVTTSDLEVLPYVIGMWTFAVLPATTTVPLWTELGSTTAPSAPSFPFRVLQIYLCTALFLNGLTKIPFWKEWVIEKGVFEDAQNWNILSPYLDTYWKKVAYTKEFPYVWEMFGVLAIVIEIGAAIPLVYPRLALFGGFGLTGLMIGNHLLRSTSFLLFPGIYFAMFSPWLPRVFI
jgi:hypothetical protein